MQRGTAKGKKGRVKQAGARGRGRGSVKYIERFSLAGLSAMQPGISEAPEWWLGYPCNFVGRALSCLNNRRGRLDVDIKFGGTSKQPHNRRKGKPSRDLRYSPQTQTPRSILVRRALQVSKDGQHQQRPRLWLLVFRPQGCGYEPSATRSCHDECAAIDRGTNSPWASCLCSFLTTSRKSTNTASRSAYRNQDPRCRAARQRVSHSAWRNIWPRGTQSLDST